jgi:hypothetical protein
MSSDQAAPPFWGGKRLTQPPNSTPLVPSTAVLLQDLSLDAAFLPELRELVSLRHSHLLRHA